MCYWISFFKRLSENLKNGCIFKIMSQEKNNSHVKTDFPDVSILIRTKNEGRHLEKTLSVLFSQTYKNFEILIVDSGSTDDTLSMARKYPVKLFEIKPEDFSFGYSLNYGIQHARGKYIICLSAHALPIGDAWIQTVIDNFSDERVAAVMTRAMPWPGCNPFDRRGLLRKYERPKMDIAKGPLSIFSNANSVIRKEIWKKVPFDETLTGSEDCDWQMKVAKLNYKIMYEPEAKLYHSHNETLKQIYRRSYREDYANRKLKIPSYPLWKMFADFSIGSLYDMFYVLAKRDNPKWLFFAPLRRFVMNYARFRASRSN